MNKQELIFQAFEWNITSNGTYWNWLQTHAERLKEMGFTAVWIPPAYKGTGGLLHDGSKSIGYDVYDLYDLGEFNQCNSIRTKYGTKEELMEAVRAMQQAGLLVYADIVLNHKMGMPGESEERAMVVDVDWNDRNRVVSEPYEITSMTKFDFEKRNNRYSDFKWRSKHFTGTDYDHSNPKNIKLRLFSNKTWAPDVDQGFGNFDYLMGADIDHHHPDVREELIKWGKWYTETLNLDGYRLDVVKHMSFDFVREWLDAMRNHQKKPLFSVGEYPTSDVQDLISYLENTPNTTLFDFPLQRLFHQACIHTHFDLRKLFQFQSLSSIRPNQAVTFVNNHDTQPGQTMNEFVDQRFHVQAYAFILLQSYGTPCVFYGDLYGIQTHQDANELSVPGCLTEISTLIRVRNQCATGTQHQVNHSADLIGFTREGVDEHTGCAVLLAKEKITEDVRMYVGKQHAGAEFACVMSENHPIVSIDCEGYGHFSLKEQAVAVYVPKQIQKPDNTF